MKRFLLLLAVFIGGGSSLLAQDGPFASYDAYCRYDIGNKTYAYCLNYKNPASVSVEVLALKGKHWKPVSAPAVYQRDAEEIPSSVRLDGPLAMTVVGGTQYAEFCLVGTRAGEITLTYYLVDPSVGSFQSCNFIGKNLNPKGSGLLIEGISSLSMIPDTTTAVYAHFASRIRSDKRLKFLSDADYLTDKTIGWWVSHNPKALTSAESVKMCSIPAKSSILASFASAKAVEKNARYKVAVFEIRGYTVVVTKTLSTGAYTLVWVEPECRNRETDRYLRAVYFENENSLALAFYQGKTFFKYHLNLVSRTLKR